MATNNNTYSGERLSFFKIFSQKNFKLVVPIIQRDYAQGRVNDETLEIRTEFLDALFGYLEENKPNRDLDFVYGTLHKDKDDEHIHFIPLDGQQRLTTLFLLHWFLFQISKNEEAKAMFKSKLLCGNRSLFTYETRQSSVDFCDALMQAAINMNALIMVRNKQGEDTPSLSETIKNEPWFFRFWRNDPTVQSMLVMIEAIYRKFAGHPEFFERLLDEENPVITFIFMDLKEYKLSDDLYIKMNSRGKPLSKFENFKAKFEQHIKTLETGDTKGDSETFTLSFAGEEMVVDLQQYFSYNIDTKWITLFWQYCKNGKQNRLDTYIENFIRIVITSHYASVAKLSGKQKSDYAFDILTGNDPSLSFSKYELAGVLTKNAVLALVSSLDALYNGNNTITHYISEGYKFYYDEDAVFDKVIHNNLSRAERMQFFAYVQYLINHRDNLSGLDEWMRVIHNLTHPDNTIADSNDDLARGIKSIVNLLPHAPRIIEYLQGISSIDGFSKHQSREECIKAHLVAKPDWKALVEKTEQHNYFNGQIGFILEFAGVCDYYDGINNLHWNDEDNDRFLAAFKRNALIAGYIFRLNDNRDRRINNKNYCFERAVLAHGDYLLERNYGYWNLLSTETVARNVKRDLSWRRLLRLGDDNPSMVKSKAFVKATFDAIANEEDVMTSLEKLCIPNTDDQWRNILIGSPAMFEVCEKGFIYKDPYQFLLIGQWFLNHYHGELFTYHLWETKFADDNIIFERFKKEYAWQKRSDELPHIAIKNFTYRKNKYNISIYTCLNDKGDFGEFEVYFNFDNEKRFDYPDEIITIMSKLQFINEDSETNWYVWRCTSGDAVLEKVQILTNELQLLLLK